MKIFFSQQKVNMKKQKAAVLLRKYLVIHENLVVRIPQTYKIDLPLQSGFVFSKLVVYLWFSKWTGFNDKGCDEVEAIECLELLEWNCGGSETGPVLYL